MKTSQSVDASRACALTTLVIGLMQFGFAVAAVPTAPVIDVATTGNSKVIIAFSAPSSDGGAAISGYTASCAAAAGTVLASAAISPIEVSALTNGVDYSCSVIASNASGASPSSNSVLRTPSATTLGSFSGNIVLGVPSSSAIKANVFTPTQSGSVTISYGTTSGQLTQQTASSALLAATPLEIALAGLTANTRYYYRMNFTSSNGVGSGPTEEYSFHTARPAASTFSFVVTGDSHPERNNEFNGPLYTRTLQAINGDSPDFYMMVGDDFSVDLLNPATITPALVTERYTVQRPYLGIVGRSAPVFLVPGNHEQSAGYLLDGTANNVAVWASNARNSHYSLPATDGFYTGNAQMVPNIGLPKNYYAWTWGDALFVAIDPYLPSPVPIATIFGNFPMNNDIWNVTHGDVQYQWLKTTLEQSTAKYKFVFAHHVLGGRRGGIEVASIGEWGGFSLAGVNEFVTKRPTWAKTIHKLMADTGVNVFFQGHDHVWVRQQLDGVTYQTQAQPANYNYNFSSFSASYLSGDKFANTGYTRVKVSPTGVKVDYVRSYLPADENATRVHGSTAFSYTLTPAASDFANGFEDITN
jgi:Calcineurin-like phosphoesterase